MTLNHPVKSWLVVVTSALLLFYSFLQMNMLNPIGTLLMRDFSINATQLGILSSAYFYGSFFLVFPAGILLDQFSPKKLLVIVACIVTLFMFVFPLTDNYAFAVFSRFMWGIGNVFGFLGALRITSRWISPNKMALATGVVITLGMLGGIVAQAPMQFITFYLGWRNTMLLVGVLGVIIIFLIMFIIEDYPAHTPSSRGLTAGSKSKIKQQNTGFPVSTGNDGEQLPVNLAKFWRQIKAVVANSYNWRCGLYISLMNLPVFLLGSLWGAIFLVQGYHFSDLQAANVNSMLFFGAIVGSPIVGFISDQLRLRVVPMIIGALLALVVIFAIMYNTDFSYVESLFVYFALGFVASAQVLGYPLIIEANSHRVTSLAMAIASLLIMMSGFVGQPLFGWLMDFKWQHVVINGTPIYSLSDFRLAMWMLPCGFIISLIMAAFTKETPANTLQHED